MTRAVKELRKGLIGSFPTPASASVWVRWSRIRLSDYVSGNRSVSLSVGVRPRWQSGIGRSGGPAAAALLFSTWTSAPSLPRNVSVEEFRARALQAASPVPVKLEAGAIPVYATGTWLNDENPARLNTRYLEENAAQVHLPMELTLPDTSVFHRTESAPLSLFLDAWRAKTATKAGKANSKASSRANEFGQSELTALSKQEQQQQQQQYPQIYIAQAPLSLLPAEMAAAFPTPELVLRAGAGDVYNSSLWLGRAPTSTPLHRDPNPNLFVQVAGRKVVRLIDPDSGSQLFRQVRQRLLLSSSSSSSGQNLSGDEKFRDESMMAGPERDALEAAVWWSSRQSDGMRDAQNAADGEDTESNDQSTTDATITDASTCIEAELLPGEALFIPLGWWHAVRGLVDDSDSPSGSGSDDVNLSVNWWFR